MCCTSNKTAASYGSFINNRPILVGISLPQSQFTTTSISTSISTSTSTSISTSTILGQRFTNTGFLKVIKK
jgi:hypothetical protein